MLAHTPLTPKFGVELAQGTQLTQLGDEELAALNQLAAERGIVVARDQAMINDEQVAFARRLGTPYTTPVNRDGTPEELLVVHAHANTKRVAGQSWHTDVSSDAEPPGLSMLRMEIVPESGGDTIFANMYEAFETLSAEMQAFLLRLSARHDPKGHYLYLSGAKRLDELPSAVHPVVRTHPATGRNALYVNEGFVGKIVELSRRESESLLRMLYDHIAYSVNIHCRVQWSPNTVVFWDNRVVQHIAAWDYFPEVRRGYRATIRGEAPVLAD